MDIQWYPGHMTKTKRMILENIAMIDIVIELLDARIPYSSKNPDIENFANHKKRIILLNKSDLADPIVTNDWIQFFQKQNIQVLLINSVTGDGFSEAVKLAHEMMKDRADAMKAKGRLFAPIKAMVAGIPNVGKSTFINKVVGKAPAKTADKPGVTKGKQWIKIKKDFWLLDTPGILWPKFDDAETGLNLAMTGAINDKIMDLYTLSLKLIEKLIYLKPDCLKVKYKIDISDAMKPEEILDKIALSRGFLIKGGEPDPERAAITLIDEFRGGKLGRISLEAPTEKLMN